MVGVADRVANMLEAVAGLAADEDGPGDLDYERPAIRVWVEDPRDAPGGRVTYRAPDGLHYYDVPLEDLGPDCEPRRFARVEPLDRADEPREQPEGAAIAKSWVPYEGPQGGEGWQNIETGDVVYDEEPPGETLGPEELAEAAEEAGYEGAEELREAIETAADEEDDSGTDGDSEEASYSIDRPHEVPIGSGVTVETDADGRFSGEVVGTSEVGRDAVYVRPDDPSVLGGRTRITVDPEGVLEVDEYEELDSEAAVEATKAFTSAKTNDLDDQTKEKVKERLQTDARNAKRTETSQRMYGHVGKWKLADEPSGGIGAGRASHRGVASRVADPDATSQIRVDNDESPRTISHETAHALADSYGYDTQTGGHISHTYPDDGLPDWDFGPDGEHGRKRHYMLTSYGDWDERESRDWDDFEERGERVDLESEASMGDRVAVEVDGERIEGSIAPTTRPVDDATDLEPGDSVSVSSGEFVGNTDEHTLTWGSVSTGAEDAEVEGVVPAGDFLVIANDNTYPLPDGADPDEVEQEPDVVDVVKMRHRSKALVRDEDTGDMMLSDATEVTDAEGVSGLSVRDPVGDEVPISEADDALLMAEAGEREWVDVRQRLATDSVRGETVRFQFGAQDETTEGVVVDETESQITIGYHDGGEYEEKQINRSQAYNQQIWYAQDQTEFADETIRPDREPPGLREAKYETMDITEAEVNWDTGIQYEDAEDRARLVQNGDLALLRGPDGDRHVIKVSDKFESFGEDDAMEIQGGFNQESEYDLTTDAPGRVEIGPGTDWDVMGHSPQEDWTDRTETGRRQTNYSPVNAGVENGQERVKDADSAKMTDPQTGETTVADVYVDPVPGRDDIILTTDTNNRYAVNFEDEIDGHPPGTLVTTGQDKERMGMASSAIKSVEAGESLSNGFRPRDNSDLEEGMMVEVRDDDGSSAVATVEDTHARFTVETDGGVFEIGGQGPGVVKVARRTAEIDEGEADDKEAAERLFKEVNKAWHDMATEHERRGSPDSSKHIGSGYSETNAHETLTKTHEAFQATTSGYSARGVVENHPDLAQAYLDVFEPSSAAKQEINDLHDGSPYKTPWDETPYPEAEPTPVSLSENVQEGDGFPVPEGYSGDWGTVQGVVEGDVLYEADDGEEYWMSAEEALRNMPGVDDLPDDVEVEP